MIDSLSLASHAMLLVKGFTFSPRGSHPINNKNNKRFCISCACAYADVTVIPVVKNIRRGTSLPRLASLITQQLRALKPCDSAPLFSCCFIILIFKFYPS